MILNERANKEIMTLLENKYERIKVYPGKCRYNYKCQMNAVHEAIENNDNFITMCMYKSKDCTHPSIHFLNHSVKDNKYIDNTIGNWSTEFDYYFIKNIYKDDFMRINQLFIELRKQLNKELSFFTRILSTVEF